MNLSQNDPKWAADKLGSSDLTIGRYGCTTTAIAMLSDYFDCYKSPTELAHDVSNYTKDGLIIWSALNFNRMRFVRREYGYNAFNILQALNNPLRAVILQVNNGQHWIVATKKNIFGNDYTIIDPWDGKQKNCLKSYNNITGAAYFEGKLDEEPKSKIDVAFSQKLAEYKYPFFLQVEGRGEVWYIHPNGERQYLNQENTLEFLRTHATGISNDDLEKVPIKK